VTKVENVAACRIGKKLPGINIVRVEAAENQQKQRDVKKIPPPAI
jgi:hypothetical protein